MRAFSMSQRLALTFSLATIYAGLTGAPAAAAFCGQPFDVKPIVKLTIATYPIVSHSGHTIDESYIRIVDVNGTYGYSVTEEGSRRVAYYWEKPTGTWRLAAANHEPSGWPKQVVTFFEGDTKGLGASPSCTNPNWKKRNSG